MTAIIATAETLTSAAIPATDYVLDTETNRSQVSDSAFILDLAVGKWIVMRRESSYRTTYHMPQVITGIFANGDFRTNEGERIGSGTGRYKGASSKRHTGEWISKAFGDEQTARNWISEQMELSARREQVRVSELVERDAKRAQQAKDHSDLVAAANPKWVENLIGDDGMPNDRWMYLPTGEYCVMAPLSKPGSDTTAVLALIAKQVERTEFDFDDGKSVTNMVWELGAGHYSSRAGSGMGSLSSGARKPVLADVLREVLESACNFF